MRQRLAKATGIEVGDIAERARRRSRSCSSTSSARSQGLRHLAAARFRRTVPTTIFIAAGTGRDTPGSGTSANGVFWMLAEHCREFKLPFDLMIGVNRRVYRAGVLSGAGSVRPADLADPVSPSCSTPFPR